MTVPVREIVTTADSDSSTIPLYERVADPNLIIGRCEKNLDAYRSLSGADPMTIARRENGLVTLREVAKLGFALDRFPDWIEPFYSLPGVDPTIGSQPNPAEVRLLMKEPEKYGWHRVESFSDYFDRPEGHIAGLCYEVMLQYEGFEDRDLKALGTMAKRLSVIETMARAGDGGLMERLRLNYVIPFFNAARKAIEAGEHVEINDAVRELVGHAGLNPDYIARQLSEQMPDIEELAEDREGKESGLLAAVR